VEKIEKNFFLVAVEGSKKIPLENVKENINICYLFRDYVNRSQK